jgi:DNA polymerase III subunit alpha
LLEKTLAGAVRGSCPVSLLYRQPGNCARIRLGSRWQVVPSDELIQELREVVGAQGVALQYH